MGVSVSIFDRPGKKWREMEKWWVSAEYTATAGTLCEGLREEGVVATPVPRGDTFRGGMGRELSHCARSSDARAKR